MLSTQRSVRLLALLFAGITTTVLGLSGSAAGAAGAADTDSGRMLLVLDSSGSMKEPAGGGQTKIEAAKTALAQVITELPDDSDVGLRVFGATVFSRKERGACTDSQLVVPPGTDNRDELSAAIADYKPYGETPIAYALKQAAADIGGEGTRSIVLVSDGIATCEPDPCKVAADIAKAGIDLRIDVVGLDVDRRARAQLSCIARAGGGQYYAADSAEEIAEQLRTVTTRAVRPFELEGEPIEGGSEQDPTAVTAGLWTDAVTGKGTDGAANWYRYERTIPGSTVHIGVSSLGTSARDSLALSAQDDAGDDCRALGQQVKFDVTSRLVVAGGSVGRDSGSPEGCQEGVLRVRVARGEITGDAAGEAAYSLQIVEEPPVTDSASLPESVGYAPQLEVPQVSGKAEPTQGGTSFGTATEVGPGAYHGTIVAGETQLWKVPVEWGQSMTARIVTPSGEDNGLRDIFGPQGPRTEIAVHNPVRATVVAGAGNKSGFATSVPGSELLAGTGEVRYLNRSSGNAADLSGYYYIEYAASEVAKGAKGDGVEMPFRLEVGVDGEQSGAPEYADGAALVTAAPSPVASADGSSDATPGPGQKEADEAAEKSSAETTGDTTGKPLRLVAAGGLGAVALAAVAVGVLLLRRGR